MPAAKANPPVRAEVPQESLGTKILDGTQTALDVAGMVPALGVIPDVANAGISALRGDWVGAGLSLAAAIPFAGWGATAAKVARRGAKVVAKKVAKEAAEKKAKEAAEKAALKAAKEKAARETAERVAKEKAEKAAAKGGKDGGKIEARKQMKQHDVKCFKKNAKGDPAEYERQLRDQERGLNSLSVKEYLEGRARFKEIGRKGTGAAQAEAREKYSKELTKKFKDQLAEQGVVGAEAQKRATAMAADKMNTLAALHNPDMIAGGKDVVTAMGDKGVNSSIGSQWKGRVAELDEAAKGIPEAERGGTMMNAKLKRCK